MFPPIYDQERKEVLELKLVETLKMKALSGKAAAFGVDILLGGVGWVTIRATKVAEFDIHAICATPVSTRKAFILPEPAQIADIHEAKFRPESEKKVK